MKSIFQNFFNKFLVSTPYEPKKFWDNWASTFMEDSWQVKIHPQHTWLLKTLKKAKPNSILEIGCGFGRNIKFLIDNGIAPSRITGVDISKNMVSMAKKFIKNPRVALLVLDIETYSPKNKYDLVFTHGLLMHIPESKIVKSIDKIKSITKSSLIFIEQNYKADNNYTFLHDYKKLLKQANLRIIEYRKDKKMRLDLIYAQVR